MEAIHHFVCGVREMDGVAVLYRLHINEVDVALSALHPDTVPEFGDDFASQPPLALNAIQHGPTLLLIISGITNLHDAARGACCSDVLYFVGPLCESAITRPPEAEHRCGGSFGV